MTTNILEVCGHTLIKFLDDFTIFGFLFKSFHKEAFVLLISFLNMYCKLDFCNQNKYKISGK